MKSLITIIMAGILVANLLMGSDWLLANPAAIGMMIMGALAGAATAQLINWVQRGKKGGGQ